MSFLFYCQGDDGSMLQAFSDHLANDTVIDWKSNPAFNKSEVKAAIVWMPPHDFFDGLDNLTHVYALAAGVDQLIAHPGLSSDVTLVRLHDAGMAVQMQEYVLYGVLHAHRKFNEFRVFQSQNTWAHGAGVRRAADVSVGILGTGALGQQVADRLTANHYPVRCWSRTPKKLPSGVENSVGASDLPEFLRKSTVLVCLLPLTDDTRGILNARLFNQLPEGAFLINVARGAHLVENDLLDALDSGQLSGALLDVFDIEPLPEEHPFWAHPRIVLTPHEAATSVVAESVDQTLSSIRQVERGEKPIGLVDRTRGY